MVAPQEEKILIFISYFGRSYAEVLGKTIYQNEQTARSKISAMKKKGLVRLSSTGLAKPRNAIILTAKSKNYLENLEYKPKVNRGAISHIKHNILEQITFFYLRKIGEVTRTSVYHNQHNYFSVPDLVLFRNNTKYAIEVETTQKSRVRYKINVFNSQKDIKSNIYSAVLYVMPNKRLMMSIANVMPIYDKLYFIDIDTMIKNINELKKISPIPQKELFKIREESSKKEKEIKKLEKYHEKEEVEKRVEKEYERKNKELNLTITQLKSEIKTTQIENENLKKELQEKEKIIKDTNHKVNEIKNLNEKYITYIKKQKSLQNRSFLDRLLNKI